MDGSPKKTKKFLYEVSVIRPTIIFLLVVLHSFTKITADGWGQRINDYPLVTPYRWFCWLISGFRIETIALIAGYVFAYQSLDLNRSYKLWPFVWKKFKRLIIPMLVFGLVYYFCFLYNPGAFEMKSFVVNWLSGCGHLWFLPMLFWCFLAIWGIDHFKLSSWPTLLILATISVIRILPLPLGFGRLSHFLFFVYAGYFLWTKREWLMRHWMNNATISGLGIAYIALVILIHTVLITPKPEMSLMQRGVVILIIGTLKLLMSCCGIMALYLFVCQTTTKKNYKPKSWLISASNDCYGVYVYHQFILIAMYFYSPLVQRVNPLIVPWIGIVVAFFISLLMTKLTLKTKVGRLLIG